MVGVGAEYSELIQKFGFASEKSEWIVHWLESVRKNRSRFGEIGVGRVLVGVGTEKSESARKNRSRSGVIGVGPEDSELARKSRSRSRDSELARVSRRHVTPARTPSSTRARNRRLTAKFQGGFSSDPQGLSRKFFQPQVRLQVL